MKKVLKAVKKFQKAMTTIPFTRIAVPLVRYREARAWGQEVWTASNEAISVEFLRHLIFWKTQKDLFQTQL